MIYKFRVPSNLSVSGHGASKVLLTGSCTVINLEGVLKQEYGLECYATHINGLGTLNWSDLPQDFDFQVISLPMDRILPRHLYLSDDFNNLAVAEARFESATALILDLLFCSMTPNRERGLVTFVYNLLVPQQNPQGRLLPRHDLRNRMFFVEELNRLIHDFVAKHQNAYVIDIDSIAASFGKMHIQDDSVWAISHGGAFSNLDYDLDLRFAAAGHLRLGSVPRIEDATYADLSAFWFLTANEVMATYRTVQQRDQVKVVVMDLDDTIWRGIAADPVLHGAFEMLEGQPMGLIEALAYLKSRGIALALVSKNDHDVVLDAWKRILGHQFSIANFVVTKINWLSKAANIAEIANELNVGLDSVVFVDDNPREREEITRSLPQVRVLGGDYFGIRRDLLWSPETQVRAITIESSRKTEMLRGQIKREQARSALSREDFLNGLDLKVKMVKITSRTHTNYMRVTELINKTNQFNTTGIRWDDAELEKIFAEEGYLAAFSAVDNSTDYGIIAASVVNLENIFIFVMSCRVIGLDVETTAIRMIEYESSKVGVTAIQSRMIETERNTLSRDLFYRAGYTKIDDFWRRSLLDRLPIPSHVTAICA
jgi:FkbH-like protein